MRFRFVGVDFIHVIRVFVVVVARSSVFFVVV